MATITQRQKAIAKEHGLFVKCVPDGIYSSYISCKGTDMGAELDLNAAERIRRGISTPKLEISRALRAGE